MTNPRHRPRKKQERDAKDKEEEEETCHWCTNLCLHNDEAERGGYYYCEICRAKIDKSTEDAKKWFDWPTKEVRYSATPEMVREELANQNEDHFKLAPRERAQVALWCAQAVDRHKRKHIPNGGMGCWGMDPDFWTPGKAYVSIKPADTVIV